MTTTLSLLTAPLPFLNPTTRITMPIDLLITPIQPGAHDFRTMDEFFNRYNQVKEIKENIPAYFLLNEYSERINVHKTVHKTLENHYGIPILSTMVKSRAAYGETGLTGTGVFEHVDKNAKSEMVGLTKEIIKIAKKHSLMQK